MQIREEIDVDGPPDADDASGKFDESSPDKSEGGGSISLLQHGQHYKQLNNSNIMFFPVRSMNL